MTKLLINELNATLCNPRGGSRENLTEGQSVMGVLKIFQKLVTRVYKNFRSIFRINNITLR